MEIRFDDREMWVINHIQKRWKSIQEEDQTGGTPNYFAKVPPEIFEPLSRLFIRSVEAALETFYYKPKLSKAEFIQEVKSVILEAARQELCYDSI